MKIHETEKGNISLDVSQKLGGSENPAPDGVLPGIVNINVSEPMRKNRNISLDVSQKVMGHLGRHDLAMKSGSTCDSL